MNLEVSLGELLAAFALVHLVTSHPHLSGRGKVPVKTLATAWAPLRSLVDCRLCFGFWAGLAVAFAARAPEMVGRVGAVGAGLGLAVGVLMTLASPRSNEHLPGLPRGLGGLVAFAVAGLLLSCGGWALIVLGRGEGWSLAITRGLASAGFCWFVGRAGDVLEQLYLDRAGPPGV